MFGQRNDFNSSDPPSLVQRLRAAAHAQVVHQTVDSFKTFSLMDWVDFSAYNPPIDALETVHTVSRSIRLPRVILLTFFDKLPCKELKLTRNNVFERDSNRCQYCGHTFERELTREGPRRRVSPEARLRFRHLPAGPLRLELAYRNAPTPVGIVVNGALLDTWRAGTRSGAFDLPSSTGSLDVELRGEGREIGGRRLGPLFQSARVAHAPARVPSPGLLPVAHQAVDPCRSAGLPSSS